MTKIRMTSSFKLPQEIPVANKIQALPYNGRACNANSLSFSFTSFDRTHKLFNLGGSDGDGTVGGPWFLDFLDCLKSVSNLTVPELKLNRTHEFHRVDWTKTNTKAPDNNKQLEYWQFRINKSKGRIIGIKIDNIFYIVYLDPHHNLVDSEGYGGIKHFNAPKSEYEDMQQKISDYEALLDEMTAP